ncbi:MAG TPA: hypothetical protein VLI04_09880, partial [Nocardioidaceae bacterium]|nr:hypothetical protein [Nocardioidaceae bacterium]
MASSLREALDDVASDVDSPIPPDDLWQRGRRRHRTRVAAGALAGTALVAALAGSWSVVSPPERTAPFVDVPDAELALPDHLYDVPRFVPGTADAGPPGPVAALVDTSSRGWWGSGRFFVTVSAVDGGYRYLDLPDVDTTEWAVLSPDGRSVAYTFKTASASGVAVYSTLSGDVVRQELPPAGRAVRVLGWSADSDRLAMGTGIEENVAERILAWRPGAGEPVEVAAGRSALVFEEPPTGMIANTRRGETLLFDAAGDVVVLRMRPDEVRSVVFGPGGRVAWVGGNRAPGGILFVAQADGQTIPRGTTLQKAKS